MQQDEGRGAGIAMHVFSGLALMVDLVLLVMAGYLTTFVRPNFVKVLQDFDTELPVLTQWMISVPGMVFVGVFFGITALLVLKEIVVEQAAVKLGANLAAGLAVLAFAAIFYLSLFLPLSSLVQQVG